MTKPRSEQIRFLSAATGTEVILDAYIESAELGGRTIADILGDIFDATGTFRADIFEFREDPLTPGILQSRVGDFVDPNAGWTNLSNTDFQSFVTSCQTAASEADAAWAATEAIYDQTVIVYNDTIAVRGQAIVAKDASIAAQGLSEAARDAAGDAATLAGGHAATTHGYMTTTEGYRDQTLGYRNESEGFKNDAEAAAIVFATHIADTANPHAVTKAQVGLGLVDNTADANKPISLATQNALNAKFDISGGTLSGPLLRDANFKIDLDGEDPTLTLDLADKIVFDRSHDTLGVVINDLYRLAISPTNVHVYGSMSTDGILSPSALNVQSDADVAGLLRRAGNTVWDASNFDPALKADLSGATFTGPIVAQDDPAHGKAMVYPGSAIQPGFINFNKPDGSNFGYVGWSDGDDWLQLWHYTSTQKGWRTNGILRADGVPAFYAFKAGGAQSSLGVVEFSGIGNNNGGYYNGSTYRFTAPCAGNYVFHANVFIQFASPSAGFGAWYFRKNGVTFGGTHHTSILTNTQSYQMVPGSIIMQLEPGDYVDIYFGVQTNTWVYNSSFSQFCGYLIG